MAKISDLIRRTNRLVDDTFDNIDLIDWFNDCNDDLEEIMFLPKQTILQVVNGEITLPEDYKNRLELVSLETGRKLSIINSSDLFSPGYYISGNKAIIRGYDDAEQMRAFYNKTIDRLTNQPEKVPEIPKQYHYLYTLFASAQAMLSDEEHERFEIFMRRYETGKYQLTKYMNAKKASSSSLQWVVIR